MGKVSLWLMAGVLLLSGCQGPSVNYLTRLDFNEGKHKNIISQFKDQVDQNISGQDLTFLCKSYYRSRNYKEFFTCVDTFKKRFSHEEYKIHLVDNPLFPFKVTGINPLLEVDIAAAYMDLQEYRLASKHAEHALSKLNQYRAKEKKKLLSNYEDVSFLFELPQFLETAGITSVYVNNRDRALLHVKSLHEIEDMFSLSHVTQAYKHRNRARLASMQIYAVLGMYKEARNKIDQMEKSGGVLHTFSSLLASPISMPTSLLLSGGEETDIGELVNIDVIRPLARSVTVADVYANTGSIEQAIKTIDTGLALQGISNFPSFYWVMLYKRGTYHAAMGEMPAAIEKFKKAIEVIETQRSSITGDAYKMGFAGDKQTVYSDLVTALMDAGHYDEAFAYAERGKARALVDMLASKKKFGGGNAKSSSDQNQLLAQLDTAEAKAGVIGVSNAERSATRSVVIKNSQALSQQAPELSSLITVDAPDVKEIQSLLPTGETLIEYYGSGDDLIAFVVSRDGIQGVKLNGKGLTEDVTAFREAILNPNGMAYRKSGTRLYNRLIAPVASGIKGKNVTIVPHAALHYLPFSALTFDSGFLIDNYNLRVLPSASVMKFLKTNKNKAGSLLALGNPDLGDKKYDLPFAQKEAMKISKGIAGSKLLVRDQATETVVKSFGNSFRYLHFASHGTFDAEKPLNSGLLLAKDNQNDGMLTVGELYDLNLNADLVTLSACETALGKIANGDDVVGFTRGFLYAGASSIVSSLWQVDDAATSDLMTSFYANLSKTDKRSALRNAQLATKAKYHHPYYWAAFQITGAVK